ncbi:MAG: carboxypeptidase-like regulatory domain-containing protein [Vicinamibacterales bacterium]
MRNRSLVAPLLAALVVVGLTEACGKEPQRIAGPSPNDQAAVVSVEISGPDSIPPGQSAQFTVIARLSDGTRQTTPNVRWFSGTSLIRIDASGLATAGQLTGEGTLSVEVTSGGALRSSREILILPENTYRMVGLVTETFSPAVPIFGARVEVMGGTPVVATTDADGRYRLYGVPGIADIRVTRDGYQPQVQRVQLAEHITQDFRLELSGARLDLAGRYTLAIDAACATSTPVAADLRHRTYAASVTQSGSTVEVVLAEPSRFRINPARRGDRFTGRVDAAGATFTLGDNFYPYYGPSYDPLTYPTIVERLSNGSFLGIDGTARTTGSRGGLSGNLQGFLLHYDSTFPSIPLRLLGSCYSTTHRFTLTAR